MAETRSVAFKSRSRAHGRRSQAYGARLVADGLRAGAYEARFGADEARSGAYERGLVADEARTVAFEPRFIGYRASRGAYESRFVADETRVRTFKLRFVALEVPLLCREPRSKPEKATPRASGSRSLSGRDALRRVRTGIRARSKRPRLKSPSLPCVGREARSRSEGVRSTPGEHPSEPHPSCCHHRDGVRGREQHHVGVASDERVAEVVRAEDAGLQRQVCPAETTDRGRVVGHLRDE